jgi:PAS domain S-box-containing protein
MDGENRELAALYDALPLGIGVFDRNFVWLRANQTLQAIAGVPDGALCGRQVGTSPEAAAWVRALVAELLESGAPWLERVVTLVDGRGQTRTWRVIVAPIRDNCEVTALSVIVEDLTAAQAAEAALAASQQRWEELADSMPQLVWTATGDGVVDYYNKQRFQFSGLAGGEDGYDWAPVLHPDDVAATVAAWETALRTGETYEMEHRVRHVDGNDYWYLSRAVPAKDETGKVVRWYGTATLIHKQKEALRELEESEARLAVAQEAAGNGVWEWNLADDSLWWGPGTYEIFGCEPGEPLTFSRFLELVHPDDLTMVGAGIEASLKQQQDWQAEFRISHQEKGVRWVEGYGRTSYGGDGKPLRMTGLNVDVTWRRQALEERERLVKALAREQEQLRQLNDELEARIRRRTEQVRALATELTLAEQRERRRLAQVLHDEVQQMLVYLQMHVNQTGREVADEAVRARLAETEGIVVDTLELTRNLTNDLGVGPLIGSERLQDALGWLGSVMAERYGLMVRLVAPEERVLNDTDMRLLLVRLVQELLFNVVKHAGVKEAEVRVEAHDGWVTVTVADEGAGFDPEAAASSRSARSGFGLASIEERLRLFGGRFAVEAAPGQGARFMLAVPVDR